MDCQVAQYCAMLTSFPHNFALKSKDFTSMYIKTYSLNDIALGMIEMYPMYRQIG